MVKKYHWYDPVLVKKIRLVMTILTWVVGLMIVFLQQERIRYIIDLLFNS